MLKLLQTADLSPQESKTVAESFVTATLAERAFTVTVTQDGGPPGLITPPGMVGNGPNCTDATTLIGRSVLPGSFSCGGGEEVAGVGVGVICDVV